MRQLYLKIASKPSVYKCLHDLLLSRRNKNDNIQIHVINDLHDAGMFIITTGKINGDRSESVLTVSAELVIGGGQFD